MIAATCAILAALIAQAHGGENFRLKGDCPTIVLNTKPPKPVIVSADSSTVRGLTITGGNIHWRKGTIRAAGGAHAASKAGYGLLIDGATEQARREGVSRAEFIRRAIAAQVKRAA